MALDAEAGTEHRGDAVLCVMLAHISSKRTRTLAKSTSASKAWRPASGLQAPQSGAGQAVGGLDAKKLSAQLLVRARAAASAKPALKKPMHRAWMLESVKEALDDGVKRGRISGSVAVAALKAFDGKR